MQTVSPNLFFTYVDLLQRFEMILTGQLDQHTKRSAANISHGSSQSVGESHGEVEGCFCSVRISEEENAVMGYVS